MSEKSTVLAPRTDCKFSFQSFLTSVIENKFLSISKPQFSDLQDEGNRMEFIGFLKMKFL